MAADGSDVRRLTRDALDSGPAWSPDGREIVFSRAKDFNSPRGIWVVDVAGGEPRQLTRTADYFDTFPAWSPDGTRIAFARAIPLQSEFDGKSAIYVMNRDGTGLELVLRHQHFARAPLGLAWSPDGRTIAFETSPIPECTAISLVDVETAAVRPLTTCTRQRESAVSPAWQPDADAGEP
jgi:Tol biopolymer transport system component